MWFSLTETYWWSGCTSSSFVIYCLWLFTDVDYFSCAKCSYYSRLMFMWFSLSKTYWWSGCTSFSFVIDIFFLWKIFYNFNTAFDNLLMLTIFHMQNVLSFSTDVYVLFSYWNILMKWMHLIFICHWHIFCVENILQFQYCFWLFTDVDYFSCENVLIILDWCLCDFLVPKHINEVDDFIFIYHWHIFCVEIILQFQYCLWLFTDVDYFSCENVLIILD